MHQNTDTKLEEVSIATLEDTTMRLLQATIQNGWPDKISKTLAELRPFWRYRDELSEVVFLILQSLRSNMLNRIHSSHLGVIKYKERAKDVLFWPGMGKPFEETVTTCENVKITKCQTPNNL